MGQNSAWVFLWLTVYCILYIGQARVHVAFSCTNNTGRRAFSLRATAITDSLDQALQRRLPTEGRRKPNYRQTDCVIIPGLCCTMVLLSPTKRLFVGDACSFATGTVSNDVTSGGRPRPDHVTWIPYCYVESALYKIPVVAVSSANPKNITRQCVVRKHEQLE